MTWRVAFAKHAQKDVENLAVAGLTEMAQASLAVLAENPYANPPPYETLVGDRTGAYSRRINIQHRLVHQVLQPARIVNVLRMWTHY